MLVADGRLQAFDGDLEDYRAWLEARRAGEKPKSNAGSLRREQKRIEAQMRQNLARARKPIEAKLRAIEADIARLEAEKRVVEAKLASADFYARGDQDEVASALREQSKLATALEKAEGQWLELQEALDRVTSDA
jgi:ATP-binding cassette subfamily F protein 3